MPRVTKPPTTPIGPKLRELIDRAGLSVPEVAERTGLARDPLYRALRPGSNPLASTIEAVLKATGKRWRDLD